MDSGTTSPGIDTAVFVAIISAASGIVVAAITYFFSKKKERAARLMQHKILQYREFAEALTVGRQELKRFCKAANIVYLIAGPQVLLAYRELLDAYICHENQELKLRNLFSAIRADLGLASKHDPQNFPFMTR